MEDRKNAKLFRGPLFRPQATIHMIKWRAFLITPSLYNVPDSAEIILDFFFLFPIALNKQRIKASVTQ